MVFASILLPILALAQADLPKVRPGVPAPPLTLQAWISGTPNRSFPAGETHLVLLWSTWDPYGRRAAMELGNQDLGSVRPMAVCVYENLGRREAIAKACEPLGIVPAALDNAKGEMAKNWVRGCGLGLNPVAFVIKDGIIEWIGRPEKAVEAAQFASQGKLDRAQTLEEYGAAARSRASHDAFTRELLKLDQAADLAQIEKTIVELRRDPERSSEAGSVWLKILAQRSPDRASTLIPVWAASDSRFDVEAAAIFATSAVREPSTRTLGVLACRQVIAKSRDPISLWYASEALLLAGDKAGSKLGYQRAHKYIDGSDLADGEKARLKAAIESKLGSSST